MNIVYRKKSAGSENMINRKKMGMSMKNMLGKQHAVLMAADVFFNNVQKTF